MKLIFATNNQHKADEINAIIDRSVRVITLREAGIDIEIPEPHDTLEENASEKVRVITNLIKSGRVSAGKDIAGCFSEDTGLEVAALNGEPGVKSARYAGDGRSSESNIDKLLQNLKGKDDLTARFRTVIALILDDKEFLFEGICPGRIIREKKGSKGFGYDPVFIPDGAHKTFGEMEIDEKAKYSHRARATEKLVAFLSDMPAAALSTGNNHKN